MNYKILVTGSKGYIGSHLVSSLISRYEVIEFNRGDDLDNLIEGCKIVYHLASNVEMTEKIEWKNLDNDLRLTIDLLEKCVKHNVNLIIYASSGGAVYGPTRGPVTELYPTMPVCPYGMLKLTIENYIRFYCDLYNFNYAILRIANPYGGKTKRGIVFSVFNALKNDIPFTIWGDGSHVRDFIYIDDLIEAMTIVSLNNLQGIFNIGTGKGTSLKKLIEMIQEITGKKLKIIYKPRRPIDSFYNVLDNVKLICSTKWSPQVELVEGLSQLAAMEK
jgi:UDP-glucose 4-epimerase